MSVPDKTVSRNHAEIEVVGDQVFITDLGSHNGTAVDGQRITGRTEVKPGAHILFGQTEFKIAVGGDSTPTSTTMQAAKLVEQEPEKSVILSMQEALKPLPKHIVDIPGLLPTLFDLASALVLPESREAMLQSVLGLIAKVIPADRLAVLFVSESQDQVFTGATLLPGGRDPGSFTLSRTIIKELLSNRNAILIGNPLDDPRFAQQQSIIMSALKSAMAVPLFDGDRVLGILYVDTTNPLHHYSDEYLRLLATFGNIIAARLVNSALLLEREEKHAMEVELRRASMIQKNLLSVTLPELSGYQIHAFQKPSRSVGGDLYDVTLLPNGNLLVVVADVSGKGMGAALLMSNILASFRIQYHDPAFNLLDAIRLVSKQLFLYSASEDFATLFAAMLDGPSGTVRYVNAGHNAPLLVRKSGATERLEPTGTLIGAFDMDPWTEATQRLEEGDLLFMFTDGVTEAMKGSEQYTDARMERMVASVRHLDAATIASRVTEDIEAFVGDNPRSDDITMAIIKKGSAC
ncbi:hypothetical protein C3F09_03850 [candidate division GN15 bacterium]|uniref:FHA domain-containing protein n=1 Tax=candidate division GN15 bacterium TaxID=2072418 RepID=A0A855X3H3_9BACT|nr:MAG: hypothetical protein C3F09_03850 [candidate division GN15 bacterium]